MCRHEPAGLPFLPRRDRDAPHEGAAGDAANRDPTLCTKNSENAERPISAMARRTSPFRSSGTSTHATRTCSIGLDGNCIRSPDHTAARKGHPLDRP